MMGLKRGSLRKRRRPARDHRLCPRVEGLEERRLLYATLGANWAHPIKITFSFVPDGTLIGGVPSTLFQTLDAKFSRKAWQNEFRAAAATWQAVAQINLVEVPDQGGSWDVYGHQQGDHRFGDIRISAIPLAFGTMGAAFSPPPINGGTGAGDIVLNSIMDWRIDSNWNLRTVAIHEIGHALGMDHASIGAAAMFSYYTTIKRSLHADDIAGIRSIYDARQPDGWNKNGNNNMSYTTAKSVDSWLTPQKQIQVPWLSFHVSGQTEWFWVTIPPGHAGRLEAQMQATGFSMLGPRLEIYDAALNFRGEASSSKYGDTITVTVPGVSQGQGFFIKASGGGGALTGLYGLQMNFGSTPLTPLPTANPVALWQPNQGGGYSSLGLDGDGVEHAPELLRIGEAVGWGDTLMIPGGGHSAEYLAAVDQSGQRFEEFESVAIQASAGVDPLMTATREDVSPAIAPEPVAAVDSTTPPGAPFRTWRGWALDIDRDRPTGGTKRLVGSLGAF